MATFKNGDRVTSDDGDRGTVVDSVETVAVRWDDGAVCLVQTDCIQHARPFAPGDWVRVVDSGVPGYVFEDDGEDDAFYPYHVALYDGSDDEEWFGASELSVWSPKIGERVVDSDDDDGVVGAVTGCVDTTTALVLWDGYPGTQAWLVDELEPADPDGEFNVGDTVEYVNPVFAGAHRGTVTAREGNVVHVVFDDGFLPGGTYPLDSLTKIIS